jgi:hypothetical protein
MDLTKKVFTPQEIENISSKLNKASKMGFLAARVENNPSLLAAFAGVEGKGISPKWNIKIYSYNKKKSGHSVVCIDKDILRILLEEDYARLIPSKLQVLRIDDAGWGFPLCGVMVGASDEQDVQTAIVPVDLFRDEFHSKRYLQVYTDFGIKILDQFAATATKHCIEICTGYVNQPLRDKLRDLGYDVRVVEIKGLLQDRLEELYKEYVHETIGSDIYYDPKGMKGAEIARRYRECLDYGKKHCPDQIKTGWDSMKGKLL